MTRYDKPLTLEQIAAVKDEDIDFSDVPELDDGFWREAKLVEPDRTVQITLRVKGSVLAHFKASGRGYQTRINQVLESYVQRIKSQEDGRLGQGLEQNPAFKELRQLLQGLEQSPALKELRQLLQGLEQNPAFKELRQLLQGLEQSPALKELRQLLQGLEQSPALKELRQLLQGLEQNPTLKELRRLRQGLR